MSRKSSVILVALSLIFTGCATEPSPEIDTANIKPITPTIYQSKPQIQFSPSSQGPASWIPPKNIERKWQTIVIHHSATPTGNSAIFDQWHKEKKWDGVGYDFVIGNGTDSADGIIEVTFRWTQQKTGAHCGGTPGNIANEKGIGICLVGDFNKKPPTQKQIQSVKKLVTFLQQRYSIPNSKIYGHGSFPGGHATDCPGKYFPMWQLK